MPPIDYGAGVNAAYHVTTEIVDLLLTAADFHELVVMPYVMAGPGDRREPRPAYWAV